MPVAARGFTGEEVPAMANDPRHEKIARSCEKLAKALREVQAAEKLAAEGGMAPDPRFREIAQSIRALGYQQAEAGLAAVKAADAEACRALVGRYSNRECGGVNGNHDPACSSLPQEPRRCVQCGRVLEIALKLCSTACRTAHAIAQGAAVAQGAAKMASRSEAS